MLEKEIGHHLYLYLKFHNPQKTAYRALAILDVDVVALYGSCFICSHRPGPVMEKGAAMNLSFLNSPQIQPSISPFVD